MSETKIDDGGQAFPMPAGFSSPDGRPNVSHGFNAGMTLRDYFAAAALLPIGYRMDSLQVNWTTERIAGMAYEIADAMLAARRGT